MINHELKCIYIPLELTGSRSIISALSLEGEYPPFLSATEKRKQYGDHLWNTYYKFTFTRNPFERLVESYRWRMGVYNDPRMRNKIPGLETKLDYTFKEYLDAGLDENQDQKALLSGETLDFIGDFTNLQSDFDKVCTTLKIEPITLPHLGKVVFDNIPSFDTVINSFDEETIELINLRYSTDLIEYDYNLDNLKSIKEKK
jgi:hypothetical protein